jgi:Fe-S-cluster containining protein
MTEERPLPRARRRGILGEETVHREGQPDVENPYWEAEEPQEHPNPELGCIRRGLCCKSHPGWFAPGEVEKAAALLGLDPDAFVRRYLVVTSVEVEGQEVHCFAPVKLGIDGEPQLEPGTKADRLYYALRGPCVFYEDAGCRIYGARPLECERYVCTNDPELNPTKAEIGRLWLGGSAP